MLAMVAGGCGTMPQQGEADREFMPATSIYNILDSTALVYSDPAAGSPINDHPLRWFTFLVYPMGQAGDYVLNRPIYAIASGAPYLFGYTGEDNMVDAQRR
jgi:hypothetical protein